MKCVVISSFLLATCFPMVAATPDERKSEVADFISRHGFEAIESAAAQVADMLVEKKEVVWVSPLDELRPFRAYFDRVNVVIVLDEGEEQESGLYVMLRVSSYIPVSGDAWSFTPDRSPICYYERRKSRTSRPRQLRSALRADRSV